MHNNCAIQVKFVLCTKYVQIRLHRKSVQVAGLMTTTKCMGIMWSPIGNRPISILYANGLIVVVNIVVINVKILLDIADIMCNLATVTETIKQWRKG